MRIRSRGVNTARQTMRKQERDTIRQVLEAALRNLTEEATDGEPSTESIAMFSDRWPSSESRGSEAPVILVVAGDLKARSQNTTTTGPASLDDTQDPAKVNSSISDHSERKVSHPGLERFKMVEGAAPTAAPRACFMEPGRACVNSGACEMRGF